MATTIFSWGYFGWGNATEQLVRTVDAVEWDRGFGPPLFVDIRIRRSVRAAGFTGFAFEDLLGPKRHLWLKGLGNEAIITKGGGIRISDPGKSTELLDLALEDAGRRVIYFCSCQWPMQDGRVACHRRTVANPLLAAARRRREDIEVIEWPGGEPGEAALNVEPEVLGSVQRGRASVPLGEKPPAARLRGLAWGSVVQLRSGREEAAVIAGPARYRSGSWELPVMEVVAGDSGDEAARHATAFRRAFGLEGRTSEG